MNININNNPTATSARNLAELSEELRLPEMGVAIALANRMVPRSQWEATSLNENDSIIIIKAACGG